MIGGQYREMLSPKMLEEVSSQMDDLRAQQQ
jgi:hypothetical protein